MHCAPAPPRLQLRAQQTNTGPAAAPQAFLGLEKNEKQPNNVPVEFETDPQLVAEIIKCGPKMRNKGDMEILVALLQMVPLFSKIKKAPLLSLAEQAGVSRYGQGDIVFSEGDRGDMFYLVLDGSVTAWVGGPPKPVISMATVVSTTMVATKRKNKLIRMRSQGGAGDMEGSEGDLDELIRRMSSRELGVDPGRSGGQADGAADAGGAAPSPVQGDAAPLPSPPSPPGPPSRKVTPRGTLKLQESVARAGSRYGKMVATMNAGATFGELALLEARGKGKRAATIRAEGPTMLMTITRKGFDQVAVAAFEAETKEKREALLRSISAMKKLSPSNLMKLTYYMRPFSFPARCRFVEAGDPLDAIYIITSGECRMDRAGSEACRGGGVGAKRRPTGWPEAPLVLLGQGQLIGDVALLANVNPPELTRGGFTQQYFYSHGYETTTPLTGFHLRPQDILRRLDVDVVAKMRADALMKAGWREARAKNTADLGHGARSAAGSLSGRGPTDQLAAAPEAASEHSGMMAALGPGAVLGSPLRPRPPAGPRHSVKSALLTGRKRPGSGQPPASEPSGAKTVPPKGSAAANTVMRYTMSSRLPTLPPLSMAHSPGRSQGSSAELPPWRQTAPLTPRRGRRPRPLSERETDAREQARPNWVGCRSQRVRPPCQPRRRRRRRTHSALRPS